MRDYGTAQWDGGDASCDHSKLMGGTGAQNLGKSDEASAANVSRSSVAFRTTCGKCGARRIDSQLGLERSLGEHVEVMTEVFREVRRVLRRDGTCWVNYGDAYASSVNGRKAADIVDDDRTFRDKPFSTVGNGLKPKDLCGAPWRVAFALQADGWYLRQDIIWSKPNPMPESVRDRCTKAHEYIFLLSKSDRYYFDQAAIAEELSESTVRIHSSPNVRPQGTGADWKQYNVGNGHSGLVNGNLRDGKRNKRSVWEIATAPFSEAHFATFPPALIEPCILAGCPTQCCAQCGAPWVREVTSELIPHWKGGHVGKNARGTSAGMVDMSTMPRQQKIVSTTGWSPSCSCNVYPTVPGTVLDPFFGAGTTGLVADRLGRNCIGIELNPEYASMAERRIRDDAGMFAQVAAE